MEKLQHKNSYYNLLLAIIIAPTLAGIATITAYSADYTWTGASTVNWSESANWTPNTGAPTQFTDTAIFSSAATRQPTVDQPLNVGNVTVSGSQSWTWSGTGPLTLGTLFSYGSSGNSTFNPQLAGAGAVRINAGTLTLAASNTFSGGTTLNAGTLDIGNDYALGAGTFTLNGGIVSCAGANRTVTNAVVFNGNCGFYDSGKILTFTGPAVMNNAVTLNVGVGAGFTLNFNNTVTDNGYGITLTGPSSWTGLGSFNANNASTLTGGLIVYGGTGSGSFQLRAGANDAFGLGTVVIMPGNFVSFSANAVSLGNTWRLRRTLTYSASNQSVTLNGDIFISDGYQGFDYTGGFINTVTFNGAFRNYGGTYGILIFNSNTGNQTFNLNGSNKTHEPSVELIGPNVAFNLNGTNNLFKGGLILRGTGMTLTIGAANKLRADSKVLLRSMSPDVVLPVLAIGYNGLPELDARSGAGVIAINTTGFDAITNFAQLGDGTLRLGSSSSGTFAGSTLAAWSNNTYRLGGGGGTLTLDRPSSSEGVLTGSAGLEIGKNGGGANFAGSVVLADANTFTGPITVNRGSTLTGNAQASGGGSPFGSSTGSVTLCGGTLAVTNGGATTAREPVNKGALTYIGGSQIQLGGSASAKAVLTLESVARDSQYRGGLLVRGMNGSLSTNEQLFITSRGSDLTNDAYGMVKPWYAILTAANNGKFATYDAANGLKMLEFNETSVLNADPGEIVTSPGVNVTEPKTMHALHFQGNAWMTGTNLTITSGGIIGTGDGRVGIGNPIIFPDGVEGVIITLASSNGDTLQMTGDIIGSCGLTKLGPQKLSLTALTSLTPVSRPNLLGPITVAAGAFQFKADAQLGPVTNQLILNGGGLDLSDWQFNIFRPVVIGPNGGYINATNGDRENNFYGYITGPGLLTKTGNQKLKLRCATNDWSGGLRITAGSVYVYGRMGTGPVHLDAGTLYLCDTTNTYQLAALSGIGNIILGPESGTGTTILEVGSGGYDCAVFGSINDNSTANSRIGRLRKAGAGVFRLYGANNFTGQIEVNAGSLIVNGLIANSANSVSVAAGATLGGCGTINRPVTISDGGILSPGDSLLTGSVGVGTLTVSNLTLSAGCTNLFEIDTATNCDKVVVNGNLVLDGVLSVSAAEGFAGGTYEIFSYTGTLTDNKLEVQHSLPPPWTAKIQIDTVQKKVFLIVSRIGGTVFFVE
jgi:autotransporter-associated beta strand protein